MTQPHPPGRTSPSPRLQPSALLRLLLSRRCEFFLCRRSARPWPRSCRTAACRPAHTRPDPRIAAGCACSRFRPARTSARRRVRASCPLRRFLRRPQASSASQFRRSLWPSALNDRAPSLAENQNAPDCLAYPWRSSFSRRNARSFSPAHGSSLGSCPPNARRTRRFSGVPCDRLRLFRARAEAVQPLVLGRRGHSSGW